MGPNPTKKSYTPESRVRDTNLSRPTIYSLTGFSEKACFQQYAAIRLLICSEIVQQNLVLRGISEKVLFSTMNLY